MCSDEEFLNFDCDVDIFGDFDKVSFSLCFTLFIAQGNNDGGWL